jgi:ectoine hydroxylase-related dioxygenase (phytanoyl-CoA dioxygenase family)
MDSAFRSDQHAFFEEHGWLVLRGVVSGQPLTRMTEAFDEALRPHLEADMPCDERGRSIWQVPGMCHQSEILMTHVHGGLGVLVADLLDAGRTQLLQDTLMVKPARVGAPIELHQDYTYIGYLQPPKAVSVRLSLTASTVETGCMYVIDRSHRWGLQGDLSVFSDRLQEGTADRLPAKLRERVAEDRIPLALQPGDVSIHHCLTHHGSFENTSGTTLKTIVTHIFDGACRLAPERLPYGAIRYFATDADGGLSPASFPVLFDRSA